LQLAQKLGLVSEGISSSMKLIIHSFR
jgi:hypothetical protein